jgi:hypothetical protein
MFDYTSNQSTNDRSRVSQLRRGMHECRLLNITGILSFQLITFFLSFMWRCLKIEETYLSPSSRRLITSTTYSLQLITKTYYFTPTNHFNPRQAAVPKCGYREFATRRPQGRCTVPEVSLWWRVREGNALHHIRGNRAQIRLETVL